jgi:hypothetical protein
MKKTWKALIVILIISAAILLSSSLLINNPFSSPTAKPELTTPTESPSTSPEPQKPTASPIPQQSAENSPEPTATEGSDGMLISEAQPIYHSNTSIKSIEDAQTLLKQNSNIIQQKTPQELQQSGKQNEANTIDATIFFNNYATAENRTRRNDQYWLLPPRPAYVLVIPAVSKLENWVEKDGKILVERINTTEGNAAGFVLPTSATTFEDVKKYLNETYPGLTSTFWTETKLWIKYLVDGNGTIYWAGQYLTSKPWIE